MNAERTDLLAIGAALKLEAATAEVMEQLRRAKVESIVLKGPSFSRWLYPDVKARLSDDIDVLVAPSSIPQAQGALVKIGFSGPIDPSPPHRKVHSYSWIRRADGVKVDLHHAISGIAIDDDEAWQVLQRETATMLIGQSSVPILNEQARALHVALHAAHHGREAGRPLEDLRLALDRVSVNVWEEAAEIAERLGATPAFAAGLRLLPRGEQIAARLRLPFRIPAKTALRVNRVPPMALGFFWLAEAHGIRAKTRVVVRELVPTPEFLRAWSPLARHGRIGLAGAYVWRTAWLLIHFVPALRAWQRAQREGRAMR